MMELRLDYFERVEASSELTLLRIAGAWEAGALPRDAVLIVLNGSERRDVAALPAALGEEGGEWRAAFGVPAGAVRPSTRYRLDVGREIPLPTPRRRGAVPAPRAAAAPRAEPIRVEPAEALAPEQRVAFRRLLGLLFAALVIGLAAAWIAGAFTTGGRSGRNPAPVLRGRTAPAIAPAARLVPLPGLSSGASGSVRLHGGRLTLALRGLGPGIFQVWAYNSVLDAAPLGPPFRGPARTVAVRVPAGTRYRYIDVSREGDGNPGHSGRSVLRVALAALRRGGASTPGG